LRQVQNPGHVLSKRTLPGFRGLVCKFVGALLALAAEILSVDTLTEIPHDGVVVRISNRNVVAGVWKMFEQMFHVSHRSLGRPALNNMTGRLSNNSPIVPTAIGLSAERPCGLAKGIRRYLFGSGE